MERDYSNDYDEWLRQTGGDTGYGNTIPTDQGGQTAAPMPTPGWTDPDNAPPDWLHNPNSTPPGDRLPAGDYWAWDGSMWVIRQMPHANNPTQPTQPTQNTTNTPTGVPTTTSTLGPGGFHSFSGLLSPRANFSQSPELDIPSFEQPAPFVYDKQFTAPTAKDMADDPGFQFRMDQGRKALEQGAAGRGVLRTGGTLKDLVNYGQNFASNEYGNVYNRRFGEYQNDYKQASDIYNTNYRGALDSYDRLANEKNMEFQPKFSAWQTNASADQRAAEMNFQREWDQYMSDQDSYWKQRNENLTREGWIWNNHP